MNRKPPEERAKRFLLGIFISGVNVKASRIQRLHEPADLHALSGTVVTVKGNIDRNLFLFAFPLKVPESQHFFLQSLFLLFLLISHGPIPPFYFMVCQTVRFIASLSGSR
jgi:hypothetical protein